MSIDTARISRLWERMTALYGARWALDYGPAMDANGGLAPIATLWAEALSDYPNGALATALRKCLDRDQLTPPSLPEFLRLCGRVPSHGASCHQGLPTTPKTPPTDTPAIRCAQLADYLTEVAQQELTPRLRPLLPDDRKNAVRAYWLSQIAASGGIGKTIAKAIQPQQEAA